MIHKRVRREEDGVNLVADIDAAIVANTGSSQRQRVRVKRKSRVVQGPGSEKEPARQPGPIDEKEDR